MKGYQSRGRFKLISMLAGNWTVYLLVLLVFSCGVLAGSFSSAGMDSKKAGELSEYIGNFVKNVESVNFESSKMAIVAVKNNIIMVVSIYALGLTMIGIPFILAILFARGFVIGFAVSFLTRDLSLQGFLLTIAAVLPHNLLYIPAVFMAAVSAVMFAVVLWKRNFNSGVAILPRLVSYTGLMLIVLTVAVAAGLVEGYATPYFTKIASVFLSSRI
ncbi:MAG: stage II sporulation protein M [Actinobacteria bacterium]|nr:stage II sporulation protein M [Actinomycetota bacterium]